MNRARLIALAAAVSAAGAGSLVFVDWDTGASRPPPPGGFMVVDPDSCTRAACGINACTAAENVLADAGSACTTRLISCPIRIGARARDWLTDAGIALGPKPYQRLRFIGLRCPGADGGSSFGIPMDDLGLPQFMNVAAVPPPCVRAPLAGGTSCQRDERDGGSRFYGELNVFPATESRGTGCEPVECRVMFGDNAETDL